MNTCDYAVIGIECVTTPHLQGFIHLKKPQRLHTLKSKLPQQIHWELAYTTDQQNSEYCKKEGNILWEIGKPSTRLQLVYCAERNLNRRHNSIMIITMLAVCAIDRWCDLTINIRQSIINMYGVCTIDRCSGLTINIRQSIIDMNGVTYISLLSICLLCMSSICVVVSLSTYVSLLSICMVCAIDRCSRHTINIRQSIIDMYGVCAIDRCSRHTMNIRQSIIDMYGVCTIDMCSGLTINYQFNDFINRIL